MLIEGSGPPAGDGSEDPKRRKKSAPGTTRLQAYTAMPDDWGKPTAEKRAGTPAPSTSTPEQLSLAAAYGLDLGQPTPSERTAAMFDTSTPSDTARREAIQSGAEEETAKAEQSAKIYRERRAKQMSWDDYLGLSDRERAAVDFNTMLIKARQKDLRRRDDYQPNESQQQVYDKAVTRMFGTGGGSETYAPETVALLNDIGFSKSDAKRFDDLDDFLGLSAALTAKDLGRLASPKAVADQAALAANEAVTGMLGDIGAAVTDEPSTPGAAAVDLATGTQALTESLTKGKQMLENWRQVGAGTLNESLGYFGGIPNRLASPDIRLGDKADEYFNAAYDALTDASSGPELLGIIQKDLKDKGIPMERFLDYADTRSKYSVDMNVGLGSNPTVQYRTPDEFRKLLGLEKGGDTDGSR